MNKIINILKKKSIPLDKFINISLYDKKFGYYMKKNPFGKNGDFITSPLISNLFGEMIAIWCVAYWEHLGKPRKILLVDSAEEMSSRTEAMLMCASRAQLTKNIIIPELMSGKWVIADRYSDSTLAYQGGGRGIDLDWLVRLNDFATFGIQPDVTFYIDVDTDIGLQRRNNISDDRIEKAGLEFQNEIRNKYLEIINYFSNRCVLIDGKLSIKEISDLIWKEIINRTSFE